MMNFIKRFFTKKKKQQEPTVYYTSKDLERIKDIPTLFDLKHGRSSEKWRKYYEKWGK